jgi:V/A-type H+-transporting ATPase subunit I
VFVPKKQEQKADAFLRSEGFSYPAFQGKDEPGELIEKYRNRLKEIEEDDKQSKEKIASFAPERDKIKFACDFFAIRADKYDAISAFDHSAHTFVVTGYVPEEDEEKLKAICNKLEMCEIVIEDAGEDAPVKLKNNRFAEPAQGIVTMYSSPGITDIDPTPILAFFYYFFFGMMFSDAGYGLLMFLACFIAIRKFRPERNMRNNLRLFEYCGISTFIWGLVYGSFFGNAPAVYINHFAGTNLTMADICPWPILDQKNDAMTIMILSVGLGLVHILVGMGCKFYVLWKNGDKKGALFDVGSWMLLLIGVAVAAAGAKFGKTIMNIGIYIALFCVAVLILTQGRGKKNIFMRLMSGVASLYDITSYVSDLLSYSRLLALGLTTGVMAEVFNLLSEMLGKSIPGIFLMVVVFILGHAINIGLNALGSYVHTMRLQYVEMFSKFYEGGGKQFEPFSLNSKYIRIKEDNRK